MSDNTVLNGTTVPNGVAVRDIQKGLAKTQVVTLDLGGAGAEKLINGAMPVTFVAPANTANWGQTLAVTAGMTATIVNIVNSTAAYRCNGMVCHGTGDGYFAIQVDAVTLVSGRTRSTAPMLILPLAGGVAINTGSNVTLKVTNESGSTADFEATLLGA